MKILAQRVAPRAALALAAAGCLLAPGRAAAQNQATFRVIDARLAADKQHAEVDILWVYNSGGSSYYNGKGVAFYVHEKEPGYGSAQTGVPVDQKVDMKNGSGTATLLVPLPKAAGPGSQLVLTGVWGSGHQWGTDEGRSGGAFTVPAHSGPVDLNTATLDDLRTLPGVGPKLAQRILDFRGALAGGAFGSVDELAGVSGFGAKKAAALKPLLAVGPQRPKAPKRAVQLVVNVNRATAAQLALLPGVSAQQAQAIVDSRQKQINKKYTGAYELARLPGWDQQLVNTLMPYISFAGRSRVPKATAQQNALWQRGTRPGFAMPWQRTAQPRHAWSRPSWLAGTAR